MVGTANAPLPTLRIDGGYGPSPSIILQQPLDVVEFDLRTGRIGETAAQLFENPAHPLHVDLAGDLHRIIVAEFVVAHRPSERIGRVLRALLAASRTAG